MDHFSEALSFYGSVFDCFEDNLVQSAPNRIDYEARYFGRDAQNIVVAEDDNMIFGHTKLDDWKNCFTKFELVEIELGSSSLDQAEMVA